MVLDKPSSTIDKTQNEDRPKSDSNLNLISLMKLSRTDTVSPTVDTATDHLPAISLTSPGQNNLPIEGLAKTEQAIFKTEANIFTSEISLTAAEGSGVQTGDTTHGGTPALNNAGTGDATINTNNMLPTVNTEIGQINSEFQKLLADFSNFMPSNLSGGDPPSTRPAPIDKAPPTDATPPSPQPAPIDKAPPTDAKPTPAPSSKKPGDSGKSTGTDRGSGSETTTSSATGGKNTASSKNAMPADLPPTPGGLTLASAVSASTIDTALEAGAGQSSHPDIISVSGNTQLQKALDDAKPGDTIELASGTYSPIYIDESGKAGAPITVEAAPGQDVVVDASNHNWGVSVQGNYVAVEGLNITDKNYSSLTLSGAKSQDDNSHDPTYGSTGITIGDNNDTPHNITLADNYIHDLSGGGIQTMQGDNMAIIGNRIDDTSKYSPWGVSGISVWHSVDTDGKANTTGVYVENNQVSDNQQLVGTEPWKTGSEQITDGNGIILDSNNMFDDHSFKPYDKGILVAGNDVSDSDRGIHSYQSDDVTITGNTALNNNTASWGLDDIDAIDGKNDSVSNNHTTNGVQNAGVV